MSLSVYKLTKPFGDLTEGQIVHLDPDEAAALLDAGLIEEASAEDVGGGEEEAEGGESPMEDAAQNAVKRLTSRLEKSVAKATEKVAAKFTSPTAQRPSFGSVPATIKEPIFKSFGHMLQAQYKAHRGDQRASRMLHAYEEELRLKAPLGANESGGGGTQGGYAVKPEWYNRIWDKVRNYPDLLGKTEQVNINSNTLNIPAINETSLANGSRHGGVQSYYVGEGSTITSSYPALMQVTASLKTLCSLVYVTNQLLQDSNIENFETFIRDKVALEFAWQHNDAVINGSGSGQPTGILNQAALVTVTKSSNDVAAMFGFDDLANMYRALYPGSRANAVWIMNPEAYSVFLRQVFVTATGTATSYPAFGGVSFNIADEFPMRIFGKPVIECMNCPQLGLPGDIILADLSQLVTAQHPGLEAAISTEIQFTTLQTAYRFVRRFDIVSPWTAALTPADGATKYNYSPFIVLQSRGT
ncbi:phage major capsid protein [Zavarzinella formosa]|uniref:phage major capsid protein n=1 Tax=Zavarzinella formosa TaxID=360055 RepID=UPI0002D8E882|nr:phage major capsid protein [Zavarzinella formosa]